MLALFKIEYIIVKRLLYLSNGSKNDYDNQCTRVIILKNINRWRNIYSCLVLIIWILHEMWRKSGLFENRKNPDFEFQNPNCCVSTSKKKPLALECSTCDCYIFFAVLVFFNRILLAIFYELYKRVCCFTRSNAIKNKIIIIVLRETDMKW